MRSKTMSTVLAGVVLQGRPNGTPDECECPADFDGDGLVSAFDLAFVLGAWGPNPSHPADFNADGIVTAFDLAVLLGAWGPCPVSECVLTLQTSRYSWVPGGLIRHRTVRCPATSGSQFKPAGTAPVTGRSPTEARGMSYFDSSL